MAIYKNKRFLSLSYGRQMFSKYSPLMYKPFLFDTTCLLSCWRAFKSSTLLSITRRSPTIRAASTTHAEKKINDELDISIKNSDSTPEKNSWSSPSIDNISPLPLSKMTGPMGLSRLPYIGPLFLFKPFSRYKIENYGELVASLHATYGPIFKTKLGKNRDVVHTSNIEDINLIFKREPKYPRRRLNDLGRIYRERRGYPQGLGTCNGEEWHSLRSVLNAPLNRPRACLQYLPSQNKVSEDLVKVLIALNTRPEKDPELRKLSASTSLDVLFRFAVESVGVICFNERLGFLSIDDISADSGNRKLDGPKKVVDPKEVQTFLDAIYTILNSTFRAIVGLERKYLRTENDAFYQNYAAAMDLIREQSARHIEKAFAAVEYRKQSANQEPPKDGEEEVEKTLLMTLINETNLDKLSIMAIVESIWAAGTDSTARNLSMMFYNLARNPEIQTRLIKEVIDVIGPDSPITSQHLSELFSFFTIS